MEMLPMATHSEEQRQNQNLADLAQENADSAMKHQGNHKKVFSILC